FGAIRLTKPSEREEVAISEFFKRDYYNQALIRIGLADFERQMQKIYGDSVELEAVLSDYMGRPVVEKQKPNAFSTTILSDVLPKFSGTFAEEWLREISSQTRRTYRIWSDQYFAEPEPVLKTIDMVATALNNLDTERLVPIEEFSEKQMGSYDALSFSGTHGKLFLKALACKFSSSFPSSTEECIELHFRAGLLSFGMLSSVSVLGLSDRNETYVYTLENLSGLKNISAHGGKVYVIEEPVVFAKLCGLLRDVKCTIVCPVYGFSAAYMYLLKMINAAKIPMYYAGNMDFKGIEFADKLFMQFGKNFIPWHYSHDDYAKVLAGESTLLPDEKKELSLHNETLASLLSQMRKTKRTASSAALTQIYADEIRISVQ
ncbi:MAG: TIGR02679 domain-containing protein, partial [Clostridiales bacterium]|nr:TIGR02679 domain-containing protein [Clostridiales bacterium]